VRDVIALRENGADRVAEKFLRIGKTPAVMVLPRRSLEKSDDK
jgi:hypothetical protein